MIRIKHLIRKFGSGDGSLELLLKGAEKNLKISALNRTAFKKLESYHDEYNEVNEKLSSGEVSKREMDQIRRKIDKLTNQSRIFEEMKGIFEDASECSEFLAEDPENQDILEMVNDLQEALDSLYDEILENILESEKYEDCAGATMEFRPGVGGTESMLFAGEMFDVYKDYCSGKGWTVQELQNNSSNRAMKFGVFKVTGENCYKYLRCESGVHKVIRVPETESKGRLHSSAMSIAVLPEIPFDFEIDENDLKIDFMRASGPGGQSVNTTDSACRVTHVPSGTQVVNQDQKSQEANKRRAMEVMRERLFKIEYDKYMAQISLERKGQVGSMDRSDKIRTYNFPQDRITDHRMKMTEYGIDSFMAGDLIDEFIYAYMNMEYNEKIEAMLRKEGVTSED